MVVLFSLAAWLTRKTLTPRRVRALKMRELTPITPTMQRLVMVMRQVSLIEDMPLMGFPLLPHLSLMRVPGASGLKVFFTRIGIFL